MSLVLEGIEHAFRRDGPHVLRGVDLQLSPGSVTAIMGPSGSGKTTLLSIAGCLVSPTRGTVSLGGQNVASRREMREFRGRSGWILQTVNALSRRTVWENIALGLVAAGHTIGGSMAAAKEMAQHMDLAAAVDRPAGSLSGGELQRLVLARALVAAPDIVFADEPTAQLDRRSADVVISSLIEARPIRTTVLIATHDPRVASACDRTLLLIDGRLHAG